MKYCYNKIKRLVQEYNLWSNKMQWSTLNIFIIQKKA